LSTYVHMYVLNFYCFSGDDDSDNSTVIIVICIVLVIICCVCFMNILFCYCCKRKETHYQHKGNCFDFYILRPFCYTPKPLMIIIICYAYVCMYVLVFCIITYVCRFQMQTDNHACYHIVVHYGTYVRKVLKVFILKASIFIVGFNFTEYKAVVIIAMLLINPCHKVVTTLLLLGIFVTRLLQPCHYHVICRQPGITV